MENNNLLSTMKEGVIILIPKPGKDKRIIDNLRPVTLLNADYKLYQLKMNIGQIVKLNQVLSRIDLYITILGWFLIY